MIIGKILWHDYSEFGRCIKTKRYHMYGCCTHTDFTLDTQSLHKTLIIDIRLALIADQDENNAPPFFFFFFFCFFFFYMTTIVNNNAWI